MAKEPRGTMIERMAQAEKRGQVMDLEREAREAATAAAAERAREAAETLAAKRAAQAAPEAITLVTVENKTLTPPETKVDGDAGATGA